jgi:RimJ/RimL family protein N-acetyltransferase
MTLRYVYDRDADVARFVASLIPHVDPRGFPDNVRGLGVVDADGRAVAGIVYYNWNMAAGTIEMAAAARPGAFWFSRETIQRAFAFVFPTCQMVKMQVLADNEILLAQLAKFGFAFVPVRRLYGRDRDGVIATYTDDDWAASRYNRPTAIQQKDAA